MKFIGLDSETGQRYHKCNICWIFTASNTLPYGWLDFGKNRHACRNLICKVTLQIQVFEEDDGEATTDSVSSQCEGREAKGE